MPSLKFLQFISPLCPVSWFLALRLTIKQTRQGPSIPGANCTAKFGFTEFLAPDSAGSATGITWRGTPAPAHGG